ncbi:glycoside hydrolase superfamily [Syncephalastrum racemosum]|uniref:beta-glucosidase n=1 Tax=Syncephalastrum racemosum TaxID=13706 RepID=A0A1X2HPK9_SYNRA|nr:glycoside hydrolase superfamily [Syncephalastrum racemosum]
MQITALTTAVFIFFASTNAAARTWEEAYEKAEALVGKMSIEQKVNITTGTGRGLCVGMSGSTTDPDFPALCLQDGPLGVRIADNITAGVSGITASQSWDKKALRKRGEYMGKEFYGKGVHAQLGPDVEVMRSPYAGRIFESFGEDPYLNGVAGVETVLGIQSEGVIAVIKHFVLNNQEHNRTTSSSTVDDRSLHEVWAWPFARAVEAGAGSVMCSYNKINGTYACESDGSLNKLLKSEMGFQGFVMSDWGATHSTVDAANNGLDMTMPGGEGYFGKNLTKAVEEGDVTEERLTDMAKRIVAAYYKMDQDDPDFPEVSLNSVNRTKAPMVDVQEDHAKLVRQLGAEATVLLLNKDEALPLPADLKKIAVLGVDAGPDPNGLNCGGDNGLACNNGTLAMGWGSGSATFPYLISPYEGIKSRAGGDVEVVHSFDSWDTDAAQDLVRDVDVAIVCASSDSGEATVVDGNAGDRNNLTLWHNGDKFIEAVADANEKTIVVIHATGPVTMPWIDHKNIKAVVWSGLPGQESGNSLADVLFGDVNPSGRLPYTIAKNEDDYPVHIDLHDTIDYKENLLVGYKWFDAKNIEPLFEFGFGLSYTNFSFSDLKVKTSDNEGELVSATVAVENTGDVDGAAVVQAYISFPESAGEPPKVLRGFDKVQIKRGHKDRVSFAFDKLSLSVYDVEKDDWVVPSGKYSIHIGASSRDIHQSTSFTL